jgi:tryptophan synthase alpha chain
MNPIDQQFSRLRATNRKAFIPFVTAGDPDVAATELVVEALIRHGSNLIEIGFPYSDPIADGPVIQASYQRALSRGIHLEDIYRLTRRIADSPLVQENGVPLVGMVSYSLVHRQGPENFVERSQEAGFSGAIVPDLPLEEFADLANLAAARDFKLIALVTPTTPRERAARIAKGSTGFLYCVSVTGITGERDQLPQELVGQLGWLRQHTDLPLCVGFGISKPDHVRMLRDAADGVIVGSAIVRLLEQSAPLEQVVSDVGRLAQSLIDALNEPRIAEASPPPLNDLDHHEGAPAPDRA